MQYKAKVTVMFRKSILDPQGAAVERALKTYLAGSADSAGSDSSSKSSIDIASVRVGKVIELTLDAGAESTESTEGTESIESIESIEEKVKVLADRILANPVMEEYAVHVEPLLDQ